MTHLHSKTLKYVDHDCINFDLIISITYKLAKNLDQYTSNSATYFKIPINLKKNNEVNSCVIYF